MRFPVATLAAVKDGRVTLAFRRWTMPRLKPGGRQRTAAGELHVSAVDLVTPEDVTETDARAAGYAGRAALLAEPFLHRPGRLWRIAFTRHDDPRAALRDAVPDKAEAEAILAKLAAKAARADFDPLDRLTLIAANPGRRAPDLAVGLGLETPVFKRQIRQLKELGLTESLKVGYRLSPRGQAILEATRR